MSSSPFKSREEEELAKRLGFKFPDRPGPASLPPSETYVIGYFNPNPWPIEIQVSELGLSIYLHQKGDYVLDDKGNKINDPILEQYVGPMRLAREVSKVKIATRRIPKVAQREVSQSPVIEAERFVRGPSGQTIPIIKPMANIIPAQADSVNLPSPGAGNPVMGMTREMAEKLKLIKPTRQTRESTVKDTAGAPPRGETIPEIDYAEDMKPGEARRAALVSNNKVPSASPPAAPPAPELNPDLTRPETDESAQLVESLKAASTIDLLGVKDISKILPQLPESETPPPDAEIQGGPAQPEAGSQSTAVQHKFPCPLCPGVGYPFRSGLDRHARFSHAGNYDEIMRPYPPKK